MGLESLLASQIIGLAEAVDDEVATLLVAGTGITLTYNDGAGTLTIANTGLGGSTGSTDNRILRSDGTGGATVQNSAVTIADNGDVSGVRILTTTSDVQAGNDVYCALNRFIGGLGAQGIQFKSSATIATHVGASGRFCLGSDTSTGSALKNSSGTLQVRLGNDSAAGALDCGAITASTLTLNAATPKITLGTSSQGYIEHSSSAVVVGYNNNNLFACFADYIACVAPFALWVYTVATLPSAAVHAGRLAQVTDSSVTTNGSNVAGGGSSRAVVYSNGTNWKVVVA